MANTCLSNISPEHTCRSRVLTSIMTQPPPPKRQKKRKKDAGAISENDPFFTSGAGTINRVTTVNAAGRRTIKEVKVPLVLPRDKKENTSVHVQENQMEFSGDPHEEPHEDLYDGEPVRPMGTRMVRYYITGITMSCSTTT